MAELEHNSVPTPAKPYRIIVSMEELLRQAFLHKPSGWYVQLFRYFFVALIAFFVDFVGLIFLKEVGHLNYIVAASLSFCAGAVVNFSLSVRWIFFEPKVSKRHQEFIAVIVIAILGLAANDVLLGFLTSAIGLYYVYSKLIATAIVFFWNFFVRKWLLYND